METINGAKEQTFNQAKKENPSQNTAVIKRMQEQTTTEILNRVNAMEQTGELVLPKGYNAGNALKSAWLYMQNIETRTKQKAIDVCTKTSICNCLLEMVIRGEYPNRHCYFIPCGQELTYWEKYTGRYMRAKRDTEIDRINAQVIYSGDNFVYTVDENGDYQLVKHETGLKNIDLQKIVGAYAVVINKDNTRHLEVMTMAQIRNSWNQGTMKGNSGAHVNFTDQMAKKTIISRACKIALDSAQDGLNDEEDESMTPPDQAKAERDAINEENPKQIEVQANEIDAGKVFDEGNQPEVVKDLKADNVYAGEPTDKSPDTGFMQPEQPARQSTRRRPTI
jgi:recombination protein RecT